MRDIFNSSQAQSFIYELDAVLIRETHEVIEGLRMRVVDNPNFTERFSGFRLHNLKLIQVIGLAYASWIIPKELGVMLMLDLEEYSKKYSLEDRTIVKLCLYSRKSSQDYLLESKLWHARDFFGNILPQWVKTINRLNFREFNRKVKRPQRKRGYHDHGTLKPSHKWLPNKDYSLTQEMNEIEQERINFQDTLNFLKGWFD